MSLERTPLSDSELSANALRVCGANVPAPSKMMAARGLAPMGPTDLATVVYQLSLDGDKAIAKAAAETASKLPENILSAALGTALDSRVIDFYAEKLIGREDLIEVILLNPRTDDDTFVTLASMLSESGLEILAVNQERLLRKPAIIEALYFNRSARMSTVDRAIELAVRNGLVLKGIPSFSDIAANIMGTNKAQQDDEQDDQEQEAEQGSQKDSLFAAALSYGDADENDEQQSPDPDVRKKTISSLSINEKIRLATLGNAFDRGELIRDSNRVVALAAIKSPGITDQEVVKYAANRGLSEDVIRYIADKREWLKSYAVKLALVANPKCPLPRAMRFLEHLRTNDLRNLARSKGIPSALATAAKRAAMRRG